MNNTFLAGVADARIFKDNELFATAKTLIDSSISIGVSAEDIRAGKGEKLFGKYFHTSTFDLKMTDAMFKLEYLAANVGSEIQLGGDVFTNKLIYYKGDNHADLNSLEEEGKINVLNYEDGTFEKGSYIPTATTNGNFISLENVLPNSKLVNCKIYNNGKNLIPYPYVNTTKTVNGITFTDNRDGSVTVNGTATGRTLFVMNRALINIVDKTKVYVLSGGRDSNVHLLLDFSYGNTWKHQINTGSATKAIIDFSKIDLEYDTLSLSLVVTANTVCDNITIKPQLELGSTATEYEQYKTVGDLSTADNKYHVPVKAIGKNLIDWSLATCERRNTSEGEYSNGILTATGNNTTSTEYDQSNFSNGQLNIKGSQKIPNNTRVTLSFYATLLELNSKTGYPQGKPTYQFYFGSLSNYSKYEKSIWNSPEINTRVKYTYTFTTTSEQNDWQVSFRLGGAKWQVEVNTLQLEVGDTATEYEPYSHSSAEAVLDTPLAPGEYIDLIRKKRIDDNAETDITVTGELKTVNSKINNIFCNTEAIPSDMEVEYFEDTKKIGYSIDIPVVAEEQQVISFEYKNKNLMPYPYANTTKVQNGLTFTDNGDGSITVNGTATADTLFFLLTYIYAGTYTLTGCPKGGSETTYCQVLGSSDYRDFGNGITRTYLADYKQNLFIKIYSGYTANNLVFKPYLIKKTGVNKINLLYKDGSNSEIQLSDSKDYISEVLLTDKTQILDKISFFDMENLFIRKLKVEDTKISSRNLLEFPYEDPTIVRQGITYKVNDDETVTVNGTASETTDAYFWFKKYQNFTLPKGIYTISGGSPDAYIYVGIYNGSTRVWQKSDRGNGLTFDLTNEEYTGVNIFTAIEKGKTVDNVTVKPQLEIGTVSTEYEPYITNLPITVNGNLENDYSMSNVLVFKDAKPMISGGETYVYLKKVSETDYKTYLLSDGVLKTTLDKDTEYCVEYLYTNENARTLTVKANFIPETVSVYLDANLYAGDDTNPLAGTKIGTITIKVPRFLLNGTQEISMSMTGAANTPFEGSALAANATGCDGEGIYAEIVEVVEGANWSNQIIGLKIDGGMDALRAANKVTDLSIYALYGGSYAPKLLDSNDFTLYKNTSEIGYQDYWSSSYPKSNVKVDNIVVYNIKNPKISYGEIKETCDFDWNEDGTIENMFTYGEINMGRCKLMDKNATEGVILKVPTLDKNITENTIFSFDDNIVKIVEFSSSNGAYNNNYFVTISEMPKNLKSLGQSFTGNFVGTTLLSDLFVPFNLPDTNKSFYQLQVKTGKVSFSENVTSIGQYALADCNLSEITDWGGLTDLGQQSFVENKFKKINIPNQITKLSNDLIFGQNAELEEVYIPNSITSINSNTFSNCANLRNIYIDNDFVTYGNLTIIPPFGAENATVVWLKYPAGIKSIKVLNDIAYIEGDGTDKASIYSPLIEYYCPTVTTISTKNIKIINKYVLYNNKNMKELICDNALTTIDTEAFSNTELTKITIDKEKDSIEGSPWGAPTTTIIQWKE